MSFDVYIRWTKMEIDMGKFDLLSDQRFAGLVPFTKKVWLASPTMHERSPSKFRLSIKFFPTEPDTKVQRCRTGRKRHRVPTANFCIFHIS